MDIKIGDLVTLNKNSFHYKQGDRFIGKVTSIRKGHDIENHGGIEIELVECVNYYLPVGEKEHFVYYNWQEDLEIIK